MFYLYVSHFYGKDSFNFESIGKLWIEYYGSLYVKMSNLDFTRIGV